MWKQTTWYPFAHASAFGRGELIYSSHSGPVIDTPRYGPQPAIESIVTRDPETATVTLFAINRSMEEAVPLALAMLGDDQLRLSETYRLTADDPAEANTAADPERVVPRAIPDATCADNRLTDVLPPMSWNVYRFVPVSAGAL